MESSRAYVGASPDSRQETTYATPQSLPPDLVQKIEEPVRSEFVHWDEMRYREIEELRNRALQMEKTMKWWSDCTANWREKWGKVRSERNRAREQCKVFQSKLELLMKECSSLRYDKEEVKKEYGHVLEELATLKGVPVSSLESKRLSRASNDHIDLDSSYAPSSEQGSEPSLKSELHFIEDVLKSTEQHYSYSRPSSVCSENLPVRDTGGRVSQHAWRQAEDRRMSQPGTRGEQEERLGGVDLTKLKQLLEETQRHLHEERNSKMALSQSADIANKENVALKKKLDEYRKQKTEAMEEVSRIQLESSDKLARLSLEIEGENESRADLDKKMKEMRSDIQRLQAENATEWARRERLETEKCALERENKNLKLQIQEAEETISRRNTNPLTSPEYKTLQADVYERNKELELLRTTHTRAKKQLHEKSGELEHCQKRLEVVEEEVYSLRKRVEDLKRELITREDEVDMRNNQIRKLQRTADEVSEHNDTLQNQLNTLETRLRQRTDAMFSPALRVDHSEGEESDD